MCVRVSEGLAASRKARNKTNAWKQKVCACVRVCQLCGCNVCVKVCFCVCVCVCVCVCFCVSVYVCVYICAYLCVCVYVCVCVC